MGEQQHRYVTYNLNWLYVVENTPEKTGYLDGAFFHPEIVGQTLRSLKALLLTHDAPMLLSAPARFIPLNDYIVSGLDAQLQAATSDQVQDLADGEHGLEQNFKSCTIVYDEPAFQFLDIVIPSYLTQETRLNAHAEFYVFPIKMTFLEEHAEAAILHIGALLNEEDSIRATIAHFEQTPLMMEALPQTGRIALTPLLAENKLRTIVADIKRITEKMKNGTSY